VLEFYCMRAPCCKQAHSWSLQRLDPHHARHAVEVRPAVWQLLTRPRAVEEARLIAHLQTTQSNWNCSAAIASHNTHHRSAHVFLTKRASLPTCKQFDKQLQPDIASGYSYLWQVCQMLLLLLLQSRKRASLPTCEQPQSVRTVAEQR
jgi:hypothetical protein